MNILYTLPSISVPHGGYRIVFEHLNGLKKLGHNVALFVEKQGLCNWYPLNFPVIHNSRHIQNYEVVVICSPHSIWIERQLKKNQRGYIFMQMVEHLFKPTNVEWYGDCLKWYLSKLPVIHGSRWGEQELIKLGRTGAMHYIGNGVNFDHFPIEENVQKDGKIVLVEGWEASNPAKDIQSIGPQVAQRLKADGFIIKSFGFHTLTTLSEVPNEYYSNPSIEVINNLYREATILVKATRLDARALSPVEAMTKGTVTVRSIIYGDDDLIAGDNCVKVPYNEDLLYFAAKNMLEDQTSREIISKRAIEYAKKKLQWEPIIIKLNQILSA